MITIIYTHPDPESYNHAILLAITDMLTGRGDDYQVIDLYADGFNPVMTRDGLAAVTSDHVADPLIERYTSMLQRTDRAIFIFPIWWGMMPAMLKGFMDRAFVKGRIYDITDNGEIMPCLSVERTLIVTTSEGDSVDFGPFVSGYLAPMVLEPVGCPIPPSHRRSGPCLRRAASSRQPSRRSGSHTPRDSCNGRSYRLYSR